MGVRAIALYLPQFHPIPENDSWWGKGFTEWINVTRAHPRFKGHHQPHLPADLGFYDLRLPEIREQQADLAREYGIYGFCYYHYWFNGKRLLNRPLDEIVATKRPDFPFCVSWANEDWTRQWDGQSGKVLIRQQYSMQDDIDHMRFICRNYFRDERYIRVNGMPLFIVYRAFNLPNPEKTVETWRRVAREEGIGDIYLCLTQSMGRITAPDSLGFDAAVEFQPDFSILTNRYFGSLVQKALHKLHLKPNPYYKDKVFFYKDLVDIATRRKMPPYKQFPCVTPSWDNTPRRTNDALIIHGSTLDLYGTWLDFVCTNFKPYSTEENFIFINAWNEWAEGNHLEPCQRWGRAYLEKTKLVLSKVLS